MPLIVTAQGCLHFFVTREFSMFGLFLTELLDSCERPVVECRTVLLLGY